MTAAAVDPALLSACQQTGVSLADAQPLRQHATDVWLLPRDQAVARISRKPHDRDQATTGVRIASWLIQQGFPATEPLIDDIVTPAADDNDDALVTFWRYYPQTHSTGPSPGHLGELLRSLHSLPTPPVTLQPYQPLTHLGHVLQSGGASLPEEDRSWLIQQRTSLVDQYHQLTSHLGTGFCHCDAYPGNTLWDGDRALLGDWDEAAWAPRELDLANTYQGAARFGRSEADLAAFTEAYGWDVRDWAGFPVLRQMRDLHTLASYIERADSGDRPALDEVLHRVRTLRHGTPSDRWNSR